MKTKPVLLAAIAAALGLAACSEKDSHLGGDLKDKVDDALDRRPNEEIRDAAEDLGKDVKKAGEDLGEAIRDVGERVREDVKEATE